MILPSGGAAGPGPRIARRATRASPQTPTSARIPAAVTDARDPRHGGPPGGRGAAKRPARRGGIAARSGAAAASAATPIWDAWRLASPSIRNGRQIRVQSGASASAVTARRPKPHETQVRRARVQGGRAR